MPKRIKQSNNSSGMGTFISGAVLGAAGATYVGLKLAQYISRTPGLSKMIQSIGNSLYDKEEEEDEDEE